MNIPQLPVSPIVNKDGNLTDVGKNFLNQLISELQTNASNEGLVSPSQVEDAKPNNNITKIQNNQNASGQYTCKGGTLLYDSTHDVLKVAILSAGVPTFKTVQTL